MENVAAVVLAKELGEKLIGGTIPKYNDDMMEIYRGEFTVSSLGIAVGPELDLKVQSRLDWGRNVIDNLCNKLMFDAFSPPEYGATRLLYETNGFAVSRDAIKNSLVAAVSFVSVRRGDVSRGEPKIVYTPYSGRQATGRFNLNTGELDAAIAIEKTKNGVPEYYLYFVPGAVFRLNKQFQIVGWYETGLKRITMIPFVYNQDLASNPFGESYLTPGAIDALVGAMRILTLLKLATELGVSPTTSFWPHFETPNLWMPS